MSVLDKGAERRAPRHKPLVLGPPTEEHLSISELDRLLGQLGLPV